MNNKLLTCLLSSALVTGGHVARAEDQSMAMVLRDLPLLQLNPIEITQAFQKSTGITLDLDEVLKVSSINEGKELRLETLDNLSITVPILAAYGPLNKDESPRLRQ